MPQLRIQFQRLQKIYSQNVWNLSQARRLGTSPPSLVRQDENFTFDWNKVPETKEKEKKKFEDYVEIFGEHRFNREVKVEDREYTVSADPAEWASVERYTSMCLPRSIPTPEAGPEKPSGFVMPTTKPGDFPYFVRRARSWLFPVYVSQGGGNGLTNRPVITTIRKVEGDVNKLCEDLDQFLFQRYEQEFIRQPNELMQKVVYRGNFDADFKDFLKMRGF